MLYPPNSQGHHGDRMAARALVGEQCRGDPDSFLYSGPSKEHRKAICCRQVRALVGEQCRGDPDSFLYSGPSKEHRKAICCRQVCRSCGQNEVAVVGASRGTTCAPGWITRAHHAHPPHAAHKPSAHACCVRLPWIHAAVAVKMGAQSPLVGDVRAIVWKGAGRPPHPLAR